MSLETTMSHTAGFELHALRLDRRIVLKASAILTSLLVGASNNGFAPKSVSAAGQTTSYDWYEVDELGAVGGDGSGGPVVVAAHFPYTAVGAHWKGETGDWPVVELSISYDGETWSDPFRLTASHDNGQPSSDGRIFTGLVCASGATHIAYAVYDQAGHRTTAPGFALTYIDSSGGPVLPAVGAENGVVARPPQIVTRAEWGADESYRFTESGEWWTLRYQTVRHAIIHHSETSNVEDPVEAMRAIYHYHAVTRGWHDIGYNFLVDRFGNIYQGRVGGQNVVAGHAYEYSAGSCGIAFVGNHSFAELSDSAIASMVAIVAWAVRFQDPWGSATFHDIADLPTICGHRDALNTTCPGDFAYDELETIRALVAETLASTADGPETGLVVGDYVVTNDDVNLRFEAGMSGEIIEQLSGGIHGVIDAGPVTRDGIVWVRVVTDFATGWTSAGFLDRNPPVDWKRGRFGRDEFVSLIESASLRELPSVNAPLIAMLDSGETGSILGGPEEADENRWYKVESGSGEGWIAARFLSNGTGGTAEPPIGVGGSFDFSLGDRVMTFDGAVNVRSEPGEQGLVLETLEPNISVSVVSEPVMASGQVWIEVTTNETTGWVAAEFLTHTLIAGGSAQVDVDADGLTVRAMPGTSSEVVSVIHDGAVVSIFAGPEIADGYTWWQIESEAATGWAAGAFLISV